MAQRIQIGNLPGFVDSLVLRRMFEVHGVVSSAMIARHSATGYSTGVGFIVMESAGAGAAAIALLNQQERYGRVLSVAWSEDATNHAPPLHHLGKSSEHASAAGE